LVGLFAGIGIALVGLLIGFFVLRALARRNVSWWSSLLGPCLAFGPAIGLIAGTWIATGSLAAAELPGVDGTSAPRPWTTNLGWSLILFFGVTGAFSLVRQFLSSTLLSEQLGVRIPSLVLDAARYVVAIVMVFVVVGWIWDKKDWFTGLFAATTVGTVIIGLALQETLVNFFAGVGIVNERTYSIGDWIWVGEDEGEVLSISRRATKIRNRTSDIVTIPNRLVMTTRVRNQSQPTPVHAEFVHVFAPYETPPNRVRAALRAAVAEVPKVLTDPAPIFRVVRFADRGVEYQVKLFLTDIAGLPDIKSDVAVQIWYHLQRAGVQVPYSVTEFRRYEPKAPSEDVAQAIRSTLSRNSFFAALPPALVEDLAASAEMAVFGAGERIVQQGAAGESCYVVRAGKVGVYVSDGIGEKHVATLEEGGLFGEMSLLTGEPRAATVRAEDDSRLVRVGAAPLRGALEKAPQFAQLLAETVALRREGILEARTVLDAQARERVRATTVRLSDLIRKFFRLSDVPPGR
jgi:small-conductance mechanosensitive channel/CRP-like cAMP-binding protein